MVSTAEAAAGNGSSDELPAAVLTEQHSSSHENWSKASKAVMPTVAVSMSLKTLRDMCGPEAVIDPSCLTSIKVLGEGAFASVELAWHQPVGSASRVKVAVKRLKPELYNAADLQLFAKEVELMRKLSHRNIVDMVGVVDGCSCSIVQEYMSGGTLKQLVTRQMLSNGGRVYSLNDGLDICLQMARGLKYLHSCSPMVIHRDLKLENVLLNVLQGGNTTAAAAASTAAGSCYEAKLADFGLSRRVEVKHQALAVRRTTSGNASLMAQLCSSTAQCELDAIWSSKAQQCSFVGQRPKSKTLLLQQGPAKAQPSSFIGSFVGQSPKSKAMLHSPAREDAFNLTGRTGSLLYMAPEVFRQEPYSEKADVFSFGVMMYEVMHRYIMLSAVSIQGTYEELEQYAARVAAGYRPPLHTNMPPSITSIIQDCWSADPLSRPTMDAVVSRLEAAAAAGDLQGLDVHEPGCSCSIC